MRRLGCLAMLWMAAMASSAALAAPPTLYNLDREVRFLSLAEARAIALESGNSGQPSLLFPGIGMDNMITAPQSSPPSGSDSIRVLAGGKRGSKSIVINVIRRDPRPAEFKRKLNQMLLNVENAYWNLYGSYWQLNSREQALRFAYETWKITTAQFRVGRISNAAVAQAEGQYNLFRSQRLQAI
ncbi:MAG: TolC family protein, partial [Gemmataceae bacterium]